MSVLCDGASHWFPFSALTNYTSPSAIVLAVLVLFTLIFSLYSTSLAIIYCFISTIIILFPTLCLYDPCPKPAFVCQVWYWMTVIIPFILITCTIATFASIISTLITGATAVGNQANRGVNFAENQGNRGVNFAENQANRGVNFAENQGNRGVNYVNNQMGGNKRNKKNKRKNK
jgi:hypothetical protein